MTSKEALGELLVLALQVRSYVLCSFAQDCANIIKQDLERLEVLERTNKMLEEKVLKYEKAQYKQIR